MGQRRICGAGAWALGWALASHICIASPQSDLQDINRKLDLQTKLPTIDETKNSILDFQIPPQLIEFLFYGGLAIGLGVLIFAIKDSIPVGFARRARWNADGEHQPVQAQEANRSQVRRTADELAKAGQFAEAMHLLLLTSLNDLRQRLDFRFADSLTSREILGRVALAAGGKSAFAALVGAVEMVHFGTSSASAEDYDVCRGYYDSLSSALEEARGR